MRNTAITSVGRWITGRDTTRDGHSTLFEMGVTSLARVLVVLALALLVAWTVAFVAPAFGGLVGVAVIGFVALWVIPFAVVRGVVRILEITEG